MSKNEKINIPKEHPILRNVFMCIFCLLIVAPIIIVLFDKVIDYNNSKDNVKTEETVGEILDYTLRTDAEGNTLEFNTTITYNIDGTQYSKVYNTEYYIAEKGQFIKMYFEKGNPYSASVTKEDNKFGLKAKTELYSLVCMIMILFFTFNAYQDIIKAKERQIMWAQAQLMIQNGGNIGNIQNVNNLQNLNNMTNKW